MKQIKQYISKFLTFINKNKDKQLHFFYIFLFTELYALLWIGPIKYFIITSFLIILGIAIGKQFIDKIIKNSKFDWKDIFAGIMGWTFSVILIIINTFKN